MRDIPEGLTFDDVILRPGESQVLPSQARLDCYVAPDLPLAAPILSAAMDTVTESAMAIAMALDGGMGVIHRNMTIEAQADMVRYVKRHQAGRVRDPLTVRADASLADAVLAMRVRSVSGAPVSDPATGRLAGVLTRRDLRFVEDFSASVASAMTSENLLVADEAIAADEARDLLRRRRVEKLLLCDTEGRCVGLITARDLENALSHPNAARDTEGRLRVAAAVSVGEDGLARARACMDAGADVVVVDTAHGHSQGVLDTVRALAAWEPRAKVMAGNVATGEGARALVDAGADAVKVGVGPGSICTTRVVSGVGAPQLSAVMEVAEALQGSPTAIIADGGIKSSGDIAKALAAGASCVMVGSLLAGTDEAPGETILYQGRAYKTYRGMGSVGAMADGSADRYFQGRDTPPARFVPEGVEGRVPARGPVREVVYQLLGGVRAAMGYIGAADLPALVKRARFMRITYAGLLEGHVHDVTVTRENSNYSGFDRQ